MCVTGVTVMWSRRFMVPMRVPEMEVETSHEPQRDEGETTLAEKSVTRVTEFSSMRFMAPMRCRKAVEATHEPCGRRTGSSTFQSRVCSHSMSRLDFGKSSEVRSVRGVDAATPSWRRFPYVGYVRLVSLRRADVLVYTSEMPDCARPSCAGGETCTSVHRLACPACCTA